MQDKEVAEVTGLMTRAESWPGGLRWIARRVKPSRRHKKNLTAHERKAAWKYSITCTDIPDARMPQVPGSHHPQFVDAVHRDHATVSVTALRLQVMALVLQRPVAQYCCILAMAWSLLIAATSASLRRTRVRSRCTRSAGNPPAGASGSPLSGLIPSRTHAQ